MSDDYGARVRHAEEEWLREQAELPWGAARWRGNVRERVFLVAMQLLMITTGWFVLGWLGLLVVVGLLIAETVTSVIRSRRGPQAGRYVRCGYDLTGAPVAVPSSLVGVSLGPSRCAECGEPWPGVPPPLDPPVVQQHG